MRRLPSPFVFFAVAAVTAAIPACGRGGDGEAEAVAVVAGAVVLAPAAGAGAAPDERRFAEAVRAMTGRLPRFPARALPGDRPRLDVIGTWDRIEQETALRLEAKLKGVAIEAPVRATIVATGRAPDAAAATDLVRRGVDDLGKALASLFVLYGAGEAAWVRALDAAEADEQVLALARLGEAKAKGAIPAIGAALGDPRAQVAEAAADALVAIGDESAVPVLIASIRRGDVRSEVRVIEAISKIGGKEARAYLEMTAIGHEIPEVRALSQGALERLAAAAKKAP
jgi:HEAT repeat protein